TPDNKKFQSAAIPDTQLPGLGISMFSSLLPVLLLALTALAGNFVTEEGPWKNIVEFLGNSSVVMIISLVIVTYTLGLRQGMNMKKVMDIYGDAVKDVGMIVLIMGGAGALKQILNDSGTSKDIAALLNGMPIHPLILGWLMASVIRVCVGSATVAGLTTSGIIAPLMAGWPEVNPNLMVLSIGAGSLMFSHVNDAGFWLFKEYFQLSIRQTIRSWSMMETIVAVGGLAGVMLINLFV
ncbi:MAG: gluconate transporter, partial [Azospira oryzae]